MEERTGGQRLKGVIYARYSSDNQREESIEGQIRECKVFAERNGIEIIGSYIDRAFSAKTDNRPDFQRMIKESSSKAFDVVLVWKLDRFARDRYDSAYYKRVLRKNGVKVVSATEAISEGAEGILLESLLEGVAEYYSVELAEKTLRGMTENALNCKVNGSVPLGFVATEDGHYQIDPIYAPIIVQIYEMYLDAMTMNEIVEELKIRGIRNRKGGEISVNVISNILKNRRYLGEYIFRDIVIPNGIPQIVPQELFDRVQERMAFNRKAPARHKAEEEYLLSTKLFCGKCQRMMAGESGTSRENIVYRYYKCSGVKRKLGCDKKTVRKDWIEDIVINELKKIIHDDETVAYIADRVMEIQGKNNSLLPYLYQQMAEAEKGIDNLVNAIQMGICNDATKKRMEELESRKTELKIQIAKEELAKPLATKEEIICWLQHFRTFDINKFEHRRRFIDTFVNRIFLYDDKIVITFNYNKGTKTITFEDLKASNILSNSNKTSEGEPEKSTCRSKCFFQRNSPSASEIWLRHVK
jgi:DNA invertase Pin-like site-specific DNA recombinase